MFHKLKERFELGPRYRFDPTDLIALLYVVGIVLTLCGFAFAGTVVLAIGAVISFVVTCLFAKRLNLLVMGVAIVVLDIFFLLQ